MMKTKTFNFMGRRYFIRGNSDNEITTKMAQKKLELMEEARQATYCEYSVDKWFGIYMQTYKKSVKEYTYYCYMNLYQANISPFIGSLPLSCVKPIMCQQILNNISHLSASYIHKTYILMRSVFFKAYENDLIKSMPVKGIEIPKGYKKERRALTDEERKVFLNASDNGRKSSLFCRIIYYCGLRPSEALRIRGGDYSGGILHVRGTKSKSAIRDVPIPVALILPVLDEGELMFHTSSGRPLEKKRVRAYWLAIRKAMDLPPENDLTLYCLRHDYCTRLEEAGVPINVASRLMGHSSVSITSKIYTHGTNAVVQIARELIDKYNSSVTPSQKVTESHKSVGFLPISPINEKTPEPLKFWDLAGAPRAIRTRNLLIRSRFKKPKTLRFLEKSVVRSHKK